MEFFVAGGVRRRRLCWGSRCLDWQVSWRYFSSLHFMPQWMFIDPSRHDPNVSESSSCRWHTTLQKCNMKPVIDRCYITGFIEPLVAHIKHLPIKWLSIYIVMDAWKLKVVSWPIPAEEVAVIWDSAWQRRRVQSCHSRLVTDVDSSSDKCWMCLVCPLPNHFSYFIL